MSKVKRYAIATVAAMALAAPAAYAGGNGYGGGGGDNNNQCQNGAAVAGAQVNAGCVQDVNVASID